MPRVKFVLAYDGSGYRGSQIQPNVPTVQETLESALRTVRAYAGRTTFAGRTDAGVHAVGQVVSCDVSWDREMHRLAHSLNSVLPHDIRVMSCEPASPDFNARFDATAREYRYHVATMARLVPQLAGYVWAYGEPLDTELAIAAANAFRGAHSFGSFASAGVSRSLTAADLTREVFDCEWRVIDVGLFPLPAGEAITELRIRATGFLPQMVRNITRAIVEVASGKQSPEWIEFLLVSGDRRLLGPPAPPHGLMLWSVEYAGNLDTVTGKMG